MARASRDFLSGGAKSSPYRTKQHGRSDSERYWLWGVICIALAAPFYVITFLLCFHKTTKQARIGIVIFWTISACIFGGVMVKFVTYGEWMSTLAPEEQRPIEKFSSVFCREVDIETNQTVSYKLTSSIPSVSKNAEVFTSMEVSVNHKPFSIEYWSFYLLKGSSFTFNLTRSRSSVRVLQVKGLEMFNSFSESFTYNRQNALSKVTESRRASQGQPVTWHLTQTDMYFFIFINDFTYSSTFLQFSGVLKLNKTVYEFEDVEVLQNGSNTKIRLQIASSQNRYVFVESPKKEEGRSYSTSIRTTCHSRDWVYWMLFSVVPAFISTIVCIFVYVFIPDCKQEQKATPSQNRSQKVVPMSASDLSNVSQSHTSDKNVNEPPNYDAMFGAPPSYETAVHKTSEDSPGPSNLT